MSYYCCRLACIGFQKRIGSVMPHGTKYRTPRWHFSGTETETLDNRYWNILTLDCCCSILCICCSIVSHIDSYDSTCLLYWCLFRQNGRPEGESAYSIYISPLPVFFAGATDHARPSRQRGSGDGGEEPLTVVGSPSSLIVQLFTASMEL